jgi:hypothetical protein
MFRTTKLLSVRLKMATLALFYTNKCRLQPRKFWNKLKEIRRTVEGSDGDGDRDAVNTNHTRPLHSYMEALQCLYQLLRLRAPLPTRLSSRVNILGAYAKLQQAITSFVMSVCPSAWNNSVPARRILIKFDTWGFFENLSIKFKLHTTL